MAELVDTQQDQSPHILGPGPSQLLSGPMVMVFSLPAESATDSLMSLDVVHPVRVDAAGTFLSFELWPHTVQKRAAPDSDLDSGPAPRAMPTFFQLRYRGRELRFNLSANSRLLAPGFVLETRRLGGLGHTHIRPHKPACHLLGRVQDTQLEGGRAAISACDGLVSARNPSWPGILVTHCVFLCQSPK